MLLNLPLTYDLNVLYSLSYPLYGTGATTHSGGMNWTMVLKFTLSRVNIFCTAACLALGKWRLGKLPAFSFKTHTWASQEFLCRFGTTCQEEEAACNSRE